MVGVIYTILCETDIVLVNQLLILLCVVLTSPVMKRLHGELGALGVATEATHPSTASLAPIRASGLGRLLRELLERLKHPLAVVNVV